MGGGRPARGASRRGRMGGGPAARQGRQSRRGDSGGAEYGGKTCALHLILRVILVVSGLGSGCALRRNAARQFRLWPARLSWDGGRWRAGRLRAWRGWGPPSGGVGGAGRGGGGGAPRGPPPPGTFSARECAARYRAGPGGAGGA